MDRGPLVEFLRQMGVRRYEISQDEKWVRCSCPLASITHQTKRDRRPSFGVFINPGGESFYNCFVCGSGSLGRLLSSYTFGIKFDLDLHEFYGKYEKATEEKEPEYFDRFAEVSSSPPVAVPDEILKDFPLVSCPHKVSYVEYERARIHSWLTAVRRISHGVIEKYGVRFSHDKMLVIFPIKDVDGKTYLLHARPRYVKEFYYLNSEMLGYDVAKWGRDDFWYGIEFIDFSKPVILVESETDVLRLVSLGVDNVMASCGPVGKRKLKRIISDVVIVGFDSDDQGDKYSKRVFDAVHLSAQPRIFQILDWSLVGIKDAGDLKDNSQWSIVWGARKTIEMKGENAIVSKVTPYKDKYDSKSPLKGESQ